MRAPRRASGRAAPTPTLPTACTASLPAPIPTTFSSDSLWQYELGTKQTLLEHRLQVNASIYYLQWKNIQQFVYLTCGLGFVPNLGNVTGKGGDLEIAWRATDDLTFGLNGAYTTTYYNQTESLERAGPRRSTWSPRGITCRPRRGTYRAAWSTCSIKSKRSRICASITSTPRRSTA